jgi:outer membrane protein TolC
MTSAFATAYYNLIKTDALIKTQTELVDVQKKVLLKAEKQYNDGMCALPVVLVEKQYLYSLENELDSLKDIRVNVINQLTVYLGDRELTSVNHKDVEDVKAFDIPEYISSDIIQNRPDMLQSELYIKKTGLDVKVARREILPKINLFGEIGFNSYYLDRVFAKNTFRSLAGFAPSLDIFSGGAKMAKVRYMKYEYQKAIELYNKTILTSLQEVNNSFSWAKMSKRYMDRDEKKYDIELQKYDLATQQNQIGALSDLDALKAEEALLLMKKDDIISKINYIISTITLYKAVGGVDYTANL